MDSETEGLLPANAKPQLRNGTQPRGVFLRLISPMWLIAVGYLDPGNWATDVQAGARHGPVMLYCIAASSLMAIVLQYACVLLVREQGGRDLAQTIRAKTPRVLNLFLWLLAEVSIVATELANVLGSAVALRWLLGMSIKLGALVTCADVLLLLAPGSALFVECAVLVLMAVIAACLVLQLALEPPADVLVSPAELLSLDRDALWCALGILGSTVMPHNLYLHTHLLQSRPACSTRDTVFALLLAMLLNGCILVVAVGTEGSIEALMARGSAGACLFGCGLLAAGQSSAMTGTIAGQAIFEGHLPDSAVSLPPWARRLCTRALTVLPTLLLVSLYGDACIPALMVGSQVVLSLQLPFAMVPLLLFALPQASRGMRAACWSVAALVVGMNGLLIKEALY